MKWHLSPIQNWWNKHLDWLRNSAMNAANRATYPVKEGSMRLWVHLETWGASLICNCNKPTIRSKHSFRRTVRVDLSVQSPKVIQYFRNQTWEYASLRIFGLSVTHFMFHLRSVQKLCWLVICSGIITSTIFYYHIYIYIYILGIIIGDFIPQKLGQ